MNGCASRDDLVVVGITEHAATQLGDVVFVELPETETMVAEGDEVCGDRKREGRRPTSWPRSMARSSR
jgi:hypothetical protein